MVKKIFKQHFFAILWFALYVGLQLFVMVFGSIFALILDENFRNQYLSNENIEISDIIYEKIVSISLISMPIIAIIIIVTFLIVLLSQKKMKNIINSIDIKHVPKFITNAIFINLFLNLAISLLPTTKYTSSLNESIDTALNGGFLFVLISTGILVPIMEEIVFRYGLCYNLGKINKYYGLIISALVFGVMHGNLIQSSYAFILGLIFGYVNEKEKSILPSIIMHISINSLTVLMVFFNPFVSLIILSVLFGIEIFQKIKSI